MQVFWFEASKFQMFIYFSFSLSCMHSFKENSRSMQITDLDFLQQASV